MKRKKILKLYVRVDKTVVANHDIQLATRGYWDLDSKTVQLLDAADEVYLIPVTNGKCLTLQYKSLGYTVINETTKPLQGRPYRQQDYNRYQFVLKYEGRVDQLNIADGTLERLYGAAYSVEANFKL